jgi:myo-inositol-1(or 4)-monophosphatase
MAASIDEVLNVYPDTAARAVEVGLGGGGDRTLIIDAEAERAVFEQLDRLEADGHSFTSLSEERGGGGYEQGRLLVVIDPIDGSLNAKRAGGPCAVSVAVADGPTVGDVVFGFIHDFHSGEEWHATRGAGAFLDGRRLDPALPARMREDGKVEVLGLESSDPRWVAAAIEPITQAAYRVRALGAIAVTLCQVAAARYDAMATLRGCRSFDAAAGQLIVREAGGMVAFAGFDPPLSAPLDLIPHAPIAAGRSSAALDAALSVTGFVKDAG